MNIKKLILFVAAFTLCCGLSVSIFAAERIWENGTVWTVGYARTKPGQYDAYIADLSKVWVKYLEAQKAAGDVVSYKILSLSSPRDGEPNLMLMVEYKNWAAFDRSPEYFEKIATKIQGSLDKSQQANIDREALRTLMGGLMAQEVVLKK